MQATRKLNKARPLKYWLQWAALCLLVFGVGIYAISAALQEEDVDKSRALPQPSVSEGRLGPRQDRPFSVSAEQRSPRPSVALKTQSVLVKRGDNLATIFTQTGLSASLLDKVMRSGNEAQRLTHIVPGDIIQFFQEEDHSLVRLQYDFAQFTSLQVVRQSDGSYKAALLEHPIEKRFNIAQGVIDQSLFQATEAAGIPIKAAYQMADIFGWDIDFARDLRGGDRFFVLYETLYKYGKKVDVGEVIATAFRNNGRLYQAVRYTDSKGQVDYYDENGRILRKTFLRTPVEYKRISSYFSLKRKHPVLNRMRAHKGVDYAAPRGTPVKATGDGILQFVGVNGGYGRVIRIQHGQKYTTVYAHLARYKKGIKKGRRVKQGETIGYVGSSGLATGPHLHYEFRVNGVHRNPLRVTFPKSRPIPEDERTRFAMAARPLLTRMALWKDQVNPVVKN